MIYKRSFLGIPIARRSNRRWLIAGYWTASICVAFLAQALVKTHPSRINGLNIVFSYAFIFGVTAVGRMVWDSSLMPEKVSGGIRTLFDSALRAQQRKNPPLDEREKHELDKAYKSAYGYMGLLVILCLILHLSQWMPQAAQNPDLLFWSFLLAYFNLPQSILIWNEPDMEECE